MKAYVFPGQGSQFPGMGKDLYEKSSTARKLFHQADEQLGFLISEIMFNGTAEELTQTKVTQPAVFLHSVILAKVMPSFKPDMVAGHSLGEISALVANNTLTFESGLDLVSRRAIAMQHATDAHPSTMAAILGLEDEVVEQVCARADGIVVAANYNYPGQLVVSGEIPAVEEVCQKLKELGAKRAVILPVGGGFHSPLMKLAENELAKAIEETHFSKPSCPIYQNVKAKAVSNPEKIQENLIHQLTAPVKWTQSVKRMIKDGADEFIEIGPGKTLQGLIRKINPEVKASSVELLQEVD